MNAIQHSLTDQVFTVTQTQRSGEVEPSQRRDSAIGGSSDNESLPRENTFTRAFRQEKRAVRSEDKTVSRSEGEKAKEAVVKNKSGKISKSTRSTSSEANVEKEGNLLSEEERETIETDESYLSPELVALVKNALDSAANPLTEVSQSQFGERLIEEISQEGTENGRKLALTLSAWIQLSEGKTAITSPEDLQSSLSGLSLNLDGAQAIGEKTAIASSTVLTDSRAIGFGDNGEAVSLTISSKLPEGSATVTEETLSQGESGSLSSLSRSDSVESEAVVTPNFSPAYDIDLGIIPVEPAVSDLTAGVTADTLPEETPNLGLGFDLSAEKVDESSEPLPKEPGFFKPEGAESQKEPVSLQTRKSTAGTTHPERQAQEGAVASHKGEETFPIEGRLTDGDNRQKSVVDQPIPGLKDLPSNGKETGAQPEKTGYPINAKPSEEGTQKLADLADTSGFQRKASKLSQMSGSPNGTVKHANQPTLWDRYQEQ